MVTFYPVGKRTLSFATQTADLIFFLTSCRMPRSSKFKRKISEQNDIKRKTINEKNETYKNNVFYKIISNWDDLVKSLLITPPRSSIYQLNHQLKLTYTIILAEFRDLKKLNLKVVNQQQYLRNQLDENRRVQIFSPTLLSNTLACLRTLSLSLEHKTDSYQ